MAKNRNNKQNENTVEDIDTKEDNISKENIDTKEDKKTSKMFEKKDILAEAFKLKEGQSSLVYLDGLLAYSGNLLDLQNYNFYKYIEEKCVNNYAFGNISYFNYDEALKTVNIKSLPVSTSNDVDFHRVNLLTRNKNEAFADWVENYIFSPIPVSELQTDNNNSFYRTTYKRMNIKNPNIKYTNITLFHDLIIYPSLLYFVDFEKRSIDYQAFMYHVYKKILIRSKGFKIDDNNLLNDFLYSANDKNSLNRLNDDEDVKSGDDLSNPSDLLRNGINSTQNIGNILDLIYK